MCAVVRSLTQNGTCTKAGSTLKYQKRRRTQKGSVSVAGLTRQKQIVEGSARGVVLERDEVQSNFPDDSLPDLLRKVRGPQ